MKAKKSLEPAVTEVEFQATEDFKNMVREQVAIKQGLMPSKPKPKPDPIEEINDYVNNKWFQQLVPLRTCCFRCRVDSPTVYAPQPGILAFGSPVGRHDRDITDHVVREFEIIGWRFQKRRSYCPNCKGLGGV
jgi:hypothetical protein